MEAKPFVTVLVILNAVLLGVFLYLFYTDFFDSWLVKDLSPSFCAEEVNGETILKYCDDPDSAASSVVE